MYLLGAFYGLVQNWALSCNWWEASLFATTDPNCTRPLPSIRKKKNVAVFGVPSSKSHLIAIKNVLSPLLCSFQELPRQHTSTSLSTLFPKLMLPAPLQSQHPVSLLSFLVVAVLCGTSNCKWWTGNTILCSGQ